MTLTQPLTVEPTNNDFLIQANQVSRSAYLMPLVQRRLIYLAVANSQKIFDKSNKNELYTLEMSVGYILRALGMNDSKKSYDEIREAVEGAVSQVLSIEK